MADTDFMKIATDVFIEFARFEYCLKQAGFLKTTNGQAEPDWNKFSNTAEAKAIYEEATKTNSNASLQYLLQNPPKRQIVSDGCLSWKTPEKIDSSQSYFVAVRRVRNNLFHGGKFNKKFFAPDRSAELMKSVLYILEFAREKHSTISAAYSEKSD